MNEPRVSEQNCLAQEWQRDGRGLWAMRVCRYYANHGKQHYFGSWRYNVEPPAVPPSTPREELIENILGLADMLESGALPRVARPQKVAEKLREASQLFQAQAQREQQVRALVDKWRELWTGFSDDGTRDCADELSTLLGEVTR